MDGQVATDQIIQGDALEVLREMPDQSAHCCITSPPYWGLRDYGVDGQLGLEKTPEEYVAKLVEVFREVWRVLRDDGTLWLVLGDSYASGKGSCHNPGGGKDSLGKTRKEEGSHPLNRGNISDLHKSGLKPKDLVGIPWRVAFALQADGWWLRSDIIWAKPNPMPESVRDRPTKSHEHIFLLTKSAQYYYDAEAIRELAQNWGTRDRTNGKYHNDGTGLQPHRGLEKDTNPAGRNKRDVWTVATKPFPDAHYAVYPPELIRPCILAGCPLGGVVLDPFMGAGTTGLVVKQEGRHYVGIELDPEWAVKAQARIARECPMELLIASV